MRFKCFIFFLLTTLVVVKMDSQERLTWNDLSDVTFKRTYNPIYDTDFLVPTFGKHVKSFVGKQVIIKGYFLDIAGDGEFLLLSKQPMATCFFCGGAGPETIIEVNFKKKPNFKTDQIIEIIGLLKLNADDVDHCNYILNNVVGTLIK